MPGSPAITRSPLRPVQLCPEDVATGDHPISPLQSPARTKPMTDQPDGQVVVRCCIGNNSKAIAEVQLSPGDVSLSELVSHLGIPEQVPLLFLAPTPRVTAHDSEGQPKGVQLVAGMKYEVILGAVPLIRLAPGHTCRPHVPEEAKWLLKWIPPPVRIIAFVGVGRCGKSTTCSALARNSGEEESVQRFPVGHDATPVTVGADVVAMPCPSGHGTALLIDCEGKDNPMMAHAEHYRAVTTLLFALASEVVHCEQVTIKESTLEDLSVTLAVRQMILPPGRHHPQPDEELEYDDKQTNDLWEYMPKLSLLVLQMKFSYTREIIDQLLAERDGQASRNEIRRTIQQAFGNLRVHKVPRLDDRGYANAIEEVRQNILAQAAPLERSGMELGGAEIADVLSALCDDLAEHKHNGRIEPESAYSRVICKHLQQVADAQFENFQQQLPKADHYCERLEEHASSVEDALQSFDQAASGINSSIKAEIRGHMQEKLSEFYHAMLDRNAEHLREEEQKAQAVVQALWHGFNTQLPPMPLKNAILAEQLKIIADRKAEQLSTFDVQARCFHCSKVAQDARQSLESQMDAAHTVVVTADQELRDKVVAQVKRVMHEAGAGFIRCVPKLVQFIEPALVLDPMQKQRALAVSKLTKELSAIAAGGKWEEAHCSEEKSAFERKIAQDCEAVAQANEEFAKQDLARCRKIESEIAAQVENLCKQTVATKQSADYPAYRILTRATEEELATKVRNLHDVYEMETKSVACRSAVSQCREALGEQTSKVLSILRQKNSELRQHVAKAAGDAAEKELSAFSEQVPSHADHWLSRAKVDALDTRPQRMEGFFSSLAALNSRDSEEAAIIHEEEVRLETSLNHHWASMLASLSDREDEDRVAAEACASSVESQAKDSLPRVPLEGKVMDIEQVRGIDQRELWLRRFDERTTGIACRPVVEAARRDLELSLGEHVSAVFLDNEQKRLVERDVRQKEEEELEAFRVALSAPDHYDPDLHLRGRTEDVISSFEEKVSEYIEIGTWEHKLCQDRQAGVKAGCQSIFEELMRRNEEFRAADQKQVEIAAAHVLERFVNGRLPPLPLRVVLTELALAQLDEAMKEAMRLFDQQIHSQGLHCTEVINAGREKLTHELQGKISTVKAANAERSATISKQFQSCRERHSRALDGLDHRYPVHWAACCTAALKQFEKETEHLLGGVWESDCAAGERAMLETSLGSATGQLELRRCSMRRRRKLVGSGVVASLVLAAACTIACVPPLPGGWQHGVMKVGALLWEPPASWLSRVGGKAASSPLDEFMHESRNTGEAGNATNAEDDKAQHEPQQEGLAPPSRNYGSFGDEVFWRRQQYSAFARSRGTTLQVALYSLTGCGLAGLLGVSMTMLGRT